MKEATEPTSLQCIESELQETHEYYESHEDSQADFNDKNEYLHNLKSECLFKENALKTAQVLIQEYQHSNQNLKMQVQSLENKVFKYQTKIQELENELICIKRNENNEERELINLSRKLTEVYEKYSELQKKYYRLQREHEKDKHHINSLSGMVKSLELQIEENQQKLMDNQMNYFLKTPQNRQRNLNSKSTNSKNQKNVKKHPNLKFSSCGDSSQNNQQEQLKIERRSNTKNSIFQQAQKSQNQTGGVRHKTADSKAEQKDKISQQKKILEWKLKEKDEEIFLMIRRNREIQQKYELLMEILHKERHQNEKAEEQGTLRYNRELTQKETRQLGTEDYLNRLRSIYKKGNQIPEKITPKYLSQEQK